MIADSAMHPEDIINSITTQYLGVDTATRPLKTCIACAVNTIRGCE